MGIVANLATGALAGSRWGYAGVFGLTAALYFLSCLTWNAFMKGNMLELY